MAINPNLTRPQLLTVNSFDVSDGQVFKYIIDSQSTTDSVWIGATLKIKNNTTDEVVYEEYKPSGISKLYEFILDPDATGLTNGVSYNAQLSYRVDNGDDSAWSNQILFYCLTQPELIINNLNESQFELNIVNSASYEFIARYYQAEGERLNSIVFNLYSVDHSLLSTSGDIYTTNIEYTYDEDLGKNFLDVSYTFNGFLDNITYYIEAKGKTEHNMLCETRPSGATAQYPTFYEFIVDYAKPSMFSVLELENICKDGYINVKSNIVDIEGETLSGNDPVYIDNNKIDLRNDGVIWDEGYQITGDFTLSSWVKSLDYTKPNIIELRLDNNNRIIIKNMVDWVDDTQYTYLDCYIYNSEYSDNMNYYIFSNSILSPSANDTVFIWLRRINNIYDIKIENLGVEDLGGEDDV